MSYTEPHWRPCPISRFPGAKQLDELLYAIVNWLEATAGLLTLGKWYPQWSSRYDDGGVKHLRDRLLRWGVDCSLCKEWFSSKIEYYNHSCNEMEDADVQPR